jgi:hypothetical protein
MNAFWTYGPIALSAVMMAVMAFTTERVYRAHKRAVKAAENYTATLDWAAAYLREHPEAYAEATMAVMAAEDKRRLN